MNSNKIDVFKNVCAICLNVDENVKLYKMKMIEQFFVDIVGVSKMRYEEMPRLLCVWCASQTIRAIQLVSRAKASADVLSRIAEHGNTQHATSEHQTANLHNLTCSKTITINFDITDQNDNEDKSISVFAHDKMNSDNFVNTESCDVLMTASAKIEFDDSILSDGNGFFDGNLAENDNEELYLKKTQKKLTKNQLKRRKKVRIKTDTDTSPAANLHENDRDLDRLQFSMQELTEEQQLAELERRRQADKFQNARYRCKDCGLVFLCAESEKNHAVRHGELAGTYVCPICHLRFATRGVYSHHRLSHRRIFCCRLCGRQVVRRALLKRHRMRCPIGGPVKDWFRCNACEKEFGDRESVRTHYRRVHGKTQSILRCEHCEKTFTRKYDLVVHIRSHTHEKPYSCPHCRRGFSVSSNLRAHISLVHQEVTSGLGRPYCVECDRHFTTARSLTRHLKRTAAHQQRD